MTIVAILVALAVLYWLGSLAYAYFTNATERSRLNKQPGLLVIALLAAVVARNSAHRRLFAVRQSVDLDWGATVSHLDRRVNWMRRFYGGWLHDETSKSRSVTIRKMPAVLPTKAHIDGAARPQAGNCALSALRA